MAGAIGELEEEREHGLGDVWRAVLRDIADRNPARLRRRDIDDVVAGGEDTDQLESRQRRDRLGGEHRLVREHDFRIGSAGNDVARGRPVVDRELTEAMKRLPGEVAGVSRMAVEDNDLRHGGTGGLAGWKATTIAAAATKSHTPRGTAQCPSR